MYTGKSGGKVIGFFGGFKRGLYDSWLMRTALRIILLKTSE